MALFDTGFAGLKNLRPAEGSSSSGQTSSTANSRKRKRGGASVRDAATHGANTGFKPTIASGSDQMQPVPTTETHVNIEKLMRKLREAEGGSSSQARRDQQNTATSQHVRKADILSSTPVAANASTSTIKIDNGKGNQSGSKNRKRAAVELEHEQQPSAKKAFIPDEEALAKREQRRKKREAKESVQIANSSNRPSKPSVDEMQGIEPAPRQNVETLTNGNNHAESTLPLPNVLTNLQKSMQKKLGGARFRWINEQLYTTSGEKAAELMKDDPSMYEEYHSGFRSQASHWPSQPVKMYIDSFLSPTTSNVGSAKPTIVDLGCGEAQLARTLVPKGFTVLSYDLVSPSAWVVQAQCTKHVPLPGSIDSPARESAAVADIVVCCLSLMGSDWLGMITESRRILRSNGLLKIAEVTSRFTDRAAFVKLLEEVGFQLVSKDESNTHFILFEFRRSEVIAKPGVNSADLHNRAQKLLKPCLYKKR